MGWDGIDTGIECERLTKMTRGSYRLTGVNGKPFGLTWITLDILEEIVRLIGRGTGGRGIPFIHSRRVRGKSLEKKRRRRRGLRGCGMELGAWFKERGEHGWMGQRSMDILGTP
jgi:hypothetical protein